MPLASKAINPDTTYRHTPDSFGMNYEQIWIPAKCGGKLNAWIIAPQDSLRGTIVMLGGDAGNMGNLLPYAAGFTKLGYRVVTFDYRGFGKSTCPGLKPYERSQLYDDGFVEDFEAVMKHVKKQYPKDKLGLYAFSMGTIIAMLSKAKEDALFIVAEGLVYDPELVKQRLKENYGKEVWYPESGKKLPEQIAAYRGHMVIFAGTEDKITTMDDAQKAVHGKLDSSITPFNSGHGMGLFKLGETYFRGLEMLLMGSWNDENYKPGR